MGVLDSILGLNSTSNTDAATSAAMSSLAQTGQQNNSVLRGTTTKANSALSSGATAATDAINQAYGGAANDVTSYAGQAQGTLANGVNNAVGTVQGSNTQYSPYVASGQGANTAEANALGLNGAVGNAAATAAFQTSPGYQFQVQQGTDAAARQAASLGLAGSGNTLSAITQLGSNLANTEYQNYLSNLSGLGSQGLTAANAVSSNNQAAGGYQYGGATTGANLDQSTAGTLGTLLANQGNQLGAIQTGLGTGTSGNLTSLGQNIANSNTNLSQDSASLGVADAQAQDAAANANAGILSKLIGSAGSAVGSALKL